MMELSSLIHIPLDVATLLLLLGQQFVFWYGSHRQGLNKDLTDRINSLYGQLHPPAKGNPEASAPV